jgi:hypothetical protein
MKSKDENVRNAKIGEGHLAAMFRQGLRELRAAFYPESNVAQPGEYGLYGTRTPGEVAEARRSDDRQLEEEPKDVLGQYLNRAERSQTDRSRESREPDLEP